MSSRTASMTGARNTAFAGLLARLRDARLCAFARDWGFVVLVLVGYFIARGQAPGNDYFAVRFTDSLVRLEQYLHIFWEPTIQQWSIHYHWSQEVGNWIYAYGHFPTLIAVGAFLWFRGRPRFMLLRNTMFISMVIGLVCYYTIPSAPPRLIAAHGYNFGFVDTIFGGHTSVDYAQPSLIRNDYAAVPSFHFGWIAMASAALWANTRSRWLRFIAVAMSALMFWAIVASANHLFIDMVIGVAVIAFSWYLALLWQRRGEQRAAVAALPGGSIPAAPRSADSLRLPE